MGQNHHAVSGTSQLNLHLLSPPKVPYPWAKGPFSLHSHLFGAGEKEKEEMFSDAHQQTGAVVISALVFSPFWTRAGLHSRNARVEQCLRNFNNLTAAAGKNALYTCGEKYLGWLPAPQAGEGQRESCALS